MQVYYVVDKGVEWYEVADALPPTTGRETNPTFSSHAIKKGISVSSVLMLRKLRTVVVISGNCASTKSESRHRLFFSFAEK